MELEELFRAYWPVVVGYLTRRTGSSTQGEELAQEVFYRATRAWLGWRGGNPVAWLMAIARNLLIDEARRGRVSVRADTIEALPVENAAIARTEIEDTLQGLSETQRRLIRLVYVDGLSHAEIAAMTGATAAAVKTSVWRARDAFKAAWTEGERD